MEDDRAIALLVWSTHSLVSTMDLTEKNANATQNHKHCDWYTKADQDFGFRLQI